MDTATLSVIRRQCGPSPAACARLQSRQFPAHAGDARADQALVADNPKERLIKIDAKVVSQRRYVVFEMAEVAIASNLFANILRLIAELHPLPVTLLA